MMQLSQQAATALQAVRRSEEVPESHETRLSPVQDPDGDLAVRLEFVEEAQSGDQVAEQGDTEVLIDPELADPLSDVLMDVQDTDQGLSFVFRAIPAGD